MEQYLESLFEVRHNGLDREDRTGVGTRSLFGDQLRFDLAEGFPLVTTKKVFLKGVIHELLWFIKGDTNVAYLQDNGVHIWDEWADDFGNLGPIYGYQWRNFGGVDQLLQVIDQIKNDPGSRRHVISAWNPMDIEDMALPPCHVMFQFYVSRGRLSCHMYQRSADMFLGVPFNIASYALLTMMIARVCGLGDGELIMSFGDRHIYHNHFDQVDEQLLREPRPLPRLHVATDVFNIEDYRATDIVLSNYDPHPAIKAPIAV